MALFQSVKEKIGALNSLGCLLQAIEKQLVTIDLENESTVTGTIQEVDGYMNIMLTGAQLVNLDNSCQHYELLYVKGRMIRYVHIPKQLSVRGTISQYLRKSKTIHRAEQNTSGSSLRQKKLQKYQQEIKDNIAKMKESRPQTESNL